MGVIRGFLLANVCGRLAFSTLIIAQTLNWLCFAMNDWGLYDTSIQNDKNRLGYGVWRICGNQESVSNCQDLDGWRLAWYGAFQGAAIFGFMGVNLACIFVVLSLYVPRCIGNRDISISCAVSSFVAAICYLIAVIIFGVRFDDTYDFGFDEEILQSCFYMAILVVLLSLIAGISAIIGLRGGHQVWDSSALPNSKQQQQSPDKDVEQGQEQGFQ